MYDESKNAFSIFAETFAETAFTSNQPCAWGNFKHFMPKKQWSHSFLLVRHETAND
jgi:hypothetical protein